MPENQIPKIATEDELNAAFVQAIRAYFDETVSVKIRAMIDTYAKRGVPMSRLMASAALQHAYFGAFFTTAAGRAVDWEVEHGAPIDKLQAGAAFKNEWDAARQGGVEDGNKVGFHAMTVGRA